MGKTSTISSLSNKSLKRGTLLRKFRNFKSVHRLSIRLLFVDSLNIADRHGDPRVVMICSRMPFSLFRERFVVRSGRETSCASSAAVLYSDEQEHPRDRHLSVHWLDRMM